MPGLPTIAPSTEVGTPVPDFSLPSTDGAQVSLADFAAAPALLVAFICNRCPFVRHVERQFGELAVEFAGRGLATVAISANDATMSPDDDVDHMREQATRSGFSFPYLYDETQEVAHAFGAACTPDFFLYGADRRLAYRGQMDDSRPSNDLPVTGESLRAAIELVLAGEPVPTPHKQCIGCGIKWREPVA